ncbi:hypothetical protein CRE_26284 [Caenorhabditis remanei]|uniref:Uncharacterized protein n=1 Tax=Caenorhabditis remanei TaxID=31234 RepID=E3LR60_CAERE|nr:hypothetical protein CRE_26284 [Caenorhabditis remanei]
MVIENKTRRLKQLIKVDVNRSIPLDKIQNWTKHLADEVFRSIPDGDDDVSDSSEFPFKIGIFIFQLDIVITLDFSGNSGMRKHMKKMIMDSLEEELLR